MQGLINAILACGLVQKLFLVDNSSTNALSVLATDKRIEYIFNNANLGYGAGHNIAIRKILHSATYHIVVNPDITFEPGTIEKMFDYMQQHPDVGHIMPKIKYTDNSLQYACRLLPTPFDLIGRRFLPPAFIKTRTYKFEMHGSGYNKIIDVPYLCGAFMFLRVEALKKAGIFDERFFLYPEDIDLTRRIHKVYKTQFYPGAVVTHLHMRASYKSLKLLWVHITNMVKYFNKWGWFWDKERVAINRKTEAQYK